MSQQHYARAQAPRAQAPRAYWQQAVAQEPQRFGDEQPQPNQAPQGAVVQPNQGPASVRTGGRRRVGGRPPRQANASRAVPKPQFLSTTATPVKNDPLFLSALVPHPGAELRPTSQIKYIQSGAVGLPEVTRQSYQDLVASTPGFARRVPPAAYEYYTAAITLGAMLKKQEFSGFRVITSEREYTSTITELNLRPPSLITTYVEGFGSTTLPNGRDLRFRMLEREYVEDPDTNTIGWYGRVSVGTHYLYAHYPCLAVYAQRIEEDMLRTQDHGRDPDWNLPDAIRPEEANAGLPTANLLGYSPSEIYKPEQLRFMREGGISNDGSFDSDNIQIPLCVPLLIAVQNELDAVKSETLKPLHYEAEGSQAQIPLLRPSIPRDARIERLQDLEMTAAVQITGALVVIEGGFAYRIKHALDDSRRGQRNNWCVYDFGAYEHVPLAWRNTANMLLDDEAPILHEEEYRTVAHSIIARDRDIARALRPAPS